MMIVRSQHGETVRDEMQSRVETLTARRDDHRERERISRRQAGEHRHEATLLDNLIASYEGILAAIDDK